LVKAIAYSKKGEMDCVPLSKGKMKGEEPHSGGETGYDQRGPSSFERLSEGAEKRLLQSGKAASCRRSI